MSLQASVDSGSETGGATDSRGSVPHVEAVERGQEPKGAQTPMHGASAGATVAPIASHTGLPVTPRDVAIARDFNRAELAEASAKRTSSYEEEDSDRGSNEKENGSDGSTHAASDPNGSDDSELGATSLPRITLRPQPGDETRGQLWGLGIAALGAVILVVGLSRRRRTG